MPRQYINVLQFSIPFKTHSLNEFAIIFLENNSKLSPWPSLDWDSSSGKLKVIHVAVLTHVIVSVNFASIFLSDLVSLAFAKKNLKF